MIGADEKIALQICNLKSEIKRSVAGSTLAICVAAAVRRQTCPPTYVGGYELCPNS